jgi:sarcosine oxidase
MPALRGAPLVAAEVCQYENTSSGDFLIDRHPARENVWWLGGGSGHGFKHGPAVGEHLAQHLLHGSNLDPRFQYATKGEEPARSVF